MIEIRKAVPDDALAIAKVHVDSWRSAYCGLLPDERLAKLDYTRGAERFRNTIIEKSELIYVAEDITGIIGFLALGPCRDPELNGTAIGEIFALYLDFQYWRKGIGRSLYNQADCLLRSAGCSQAVLWVFEGNERARMFYEAMGFVTDGATRIIDVGAPVNGLRYRKNL